MWMSRTLTLIASLALLLSTLSGVAHDHGAAIERGGYDCAVDHHAAEAADEIAAPGAHAEMRQSSRLHRHRCVGCHLNGPRPLLSTYREGAASLPVSVEQVSPAVDHPRVFTSRRGYSLRAPPRA